MMEREAQQQQQQCRADGGAEARVDLFAAEAIALTLPGEAARVLGVVEIRECLEGETVREALDLLGQVFALPDPYGRLRRIARGRGLGFYGPGAAEHDPARAFRGFCAYVEAKRARGDTETSAEELASRFYAPRQRAAMAGISEAVWESYEQRAPAPEEEGTQQQAEQQPRETDGGAGARDAA